MDASRARRLASAIRILGARTSEEILAVLDASPVGRQTSREERYEVLRAAQERVCEG